MIEDESTRTKPLYHDLARLSPNAGATQEKHNESLTKEEGVESPVEVTPAEDVPPNGG